MTNSVTTSARHFEGYLPRIAMLLLVLTILLFVTESWKVVPHYDDSYITYRYARNFVEGHGLVYNVGEYVEGYTNLLWTVLIACGIAAGFESETVGHVLGLLSASGAMVAVFAYSWVLLPSRFCWMAALGPIMLLSYSVFVYISTAGMETALSVASATAGLAALAAGRIWIATVIASIATLTRPDGLILGAVVFAAHLYLDKATLGRRLMPVAAYAMVVASLTLFRLLYYGSPVPNTFYAKVGGLPIMQGLRWTAGFLSTHWLLLIPFLAGVTHRACWTGGLFVVLNLLYVIATVSSGSRLILPIVPVVIAISIAGTGRVMNSSRSLGIVLFACLLGFIGSLVFGEIVSTSIVGGGIVLAVSTLANRTARQVLAACAASALLVAAAAAAGAEFGFGSWRKPLTTSQRSSELKSKRLQDQYLVSLMKGNCRQLAERPEIRLVAAGAIGALGYFSRLPIVDILGLVDPVVARSTDELSSDLPGPVLVGSGHQRSAASYVMTRKPDMIKIAKKGTKQVAYLPAQLALWAHPDLDRCYRWDASVKGYVRMGCE